MDNANHSTEPHSTQLSNPVQSPTPRLSPTPRRHPSSEELDEDEDYQECLNANKKSKNKSKKRTVVLFRVSTRRQPSKNLPTSCSSQFLDESSLFQQNTYYLQPEDARYLTQRIRY